MARIEQLPPRMNAIDALFWLMEPRPEFRSSIGGLLVLDGVPGHERLRDEFVRLSTSYARMRQRVVESPLNLAPPEWLPDPDFDLDYHLRTLALPPGATLEDLLEALGPIFATPLDRARPLWEAYVAGPFGRDRSAVFVKVHHCLMDGVGGTRIMTDLLGDGGGVAPVRAPPAAPSSDLSARLARAAVAALDELAGDAGAAVGALVGSAFRPLATARAAVGRIESAIGLARELVMSRSESPLHRHRSLSRRLATFDIRLDEIDAVRTRVGATNNDVLLTVVAGALHRWHTAHRADVRELRALVPVNLRAAGDDVAGNRIALLAVTLPVGEPDPLRRLRIVQERMGRVKRDRRARLYPLVARLVAALPASIAARIVGQQMNRANFVCTNVPGPERTCRLAGAPIAAMYAFAPMVGDHPVAVAAFRYRDVVHVGLDVDPLAMDDLPHFVDGLAESWAETRSLRRAGLEPSPPTSAVGAR